MARGKGECPIYKRKRKRADGTEYFIYAFDLVMPDGKKKPFYSRVGEKKGDFQKRKTQIMIEHQKQINLKSSGVLTKDLLHNWCVSKRNVTKETLDVYMDYINFYINPFIGNIPWRQLTETNIENLITQLHIHGGISVDRHNRAKKPKPLAPSVLKKVKSILSQSFEYAIRHNLATMNYAKEITLPSITKPIIKPMTEDDILRSLKEAKNSPMYIAILLDIAIGVRRGELLALQWTDIDFLLGIANIHRQLLSVKGGVKIVERVKTDGSTRQVGIPDKVLEALIIEKQNQLIRYKRCPEKYFNSDIDHNLVIRQANGKHYNPRTFARNFERVLKRAGIERRQVKDMRHTFATQLLTKGAYINEVQAALGHADPKTTLQNYAHILPGRQKEIAKRMNDILPI